MRRGWKAAAAGALAPVAIAIAPSGATAAPGTVYGGATSQDDPVALVVSQDHRRLVRLIAHVDLRCSDGAATDWSSFTSFAGRARISPTGRIDVRNSTVALAGTLRGSTARGTISVSESFADPNTGAKATCTSGRVTFRTRSERGSIFAGLTLKGHPVVLELAADRLAVRSLRYGWEAPCQHDGLLAIGDSFGGFPLGPKRGFGASFLLDPIDLGGGAHRNVAYSLHGRAGKTEASGTFSMTATDTDPTGATTDTCTTGRETWRAVT
jgi:hypothetical protein